MSPSEFSNSFDVLLNSYATELPIGKEANEIGFPTLALDEYEKSLFLTEAEKEIVLGIYNGKNILGDAFEGTEEARRYLSNLNDEEEMSPIANLGGAPLGISKHSQFFTLPEDLWFITYEEVRVKGTGGKCGDEMTQAVIPITLDEYHKIKKNPFRGANKHRALRLDLADGVSEIVSDYDIIRYYIRYLRKVKPIILTDLPDDLTIEGFSSVTPCELHESIHKRILDRAVELAIASKGRITNQK